MDDVELAELYFVLLVTFIQCIAKHSWVVPKYIECRQSRLLVARGSDGLVYILPPSSVLEEESEGHPIASSSVVLRRI
jgi:hypothetical protein